VTSLTLDRSAILNLVESARPLSDVRELLLSWAEAGASREAIRSALNEVRSQLRVAGREAEEDRVLEALDLVEGWVSPHLKIAFSGPDVAPDSVPTRNVATVLLPRDGEFAQIASDLVLPALTEAGFEARSPSQEAAEANTVFALIEEIKRSDVVVVDATGLDAFLLYALGVAHALEKPSVVLTQDIRDLPFDLRSYNVVTYSTRLDEISRLKDDLLKILHEFAEFDYVLATPVSDTGGSRRSSAGNKTVDQAVELLGIYDLVPSSVQAMEGITSATVEFGTLTERLGEAMQAQTAEIEVAKARGGPGAFSRSLLGVRTVTAHVDEYADQVSDILPRYADQWAAFVGDTLAWLELVDMQSEEDREAGLSFANQLADVRQLILSTVQHVEGFREAVVGLRARRLSKELGRSLGRVDRQLKEWIDQVLTGASNLERMRALVAERVDRPDSASHTS
jgi:nucleoside 2-deoxyribosyltransferase